MDFCSFLRQFQHANLKIGHTISDEQLMTKFLSIFVTCHSTDTGKDAYDQVLYELANACIEKESGNEAAITEQHKHALQSFAHLFKYLMQIKVKYKFKVHRRDPLIQWRETVKAVDSPNHAAGSSAVILLNQFQETQQQVLALRSRDRKSGSSINVTGLCTKPPVTCTHVHNTNVHEHARAPPRAVSLGS